LRTSTGLPRRGSYRYRDAMIPDELRALYPGLSEEELSVIMENLNQYLLVAWEIIEDVSTDPPVDSDGDDR
jgi:hypothetical protein